MGFGLFGRFEDTEAKGGQWSDRDTDTDRVNMVQLSKINRKFQIRGSGTNVKVVILQYPLTLCAALTVCGKKPHAWVKNS